MALHSVWYRSGLGAGASALVATNQFSNYAGLKGNVAISAPGFIRFDVYDLDAGAPTPAPGDYLEVRYGETPVTDPVTWSGIIREAAEDKHDPGVWHIVAADPINEVKRRSLAARGVDSAASERNAAIDILTDLGITTASAPIRYTAASILAGAAGTALTAYRRHYDNGLKLLRQLCLTFGRELGYTRESNGAGGFVWTIQYLTQLGGAAATVSQATWRAGDDTGRMYDITDDYDKKDAVTVLAQGDGSEAVSTTAGAGGAGSPRATVPMKSVNDTAVATAAATTLQTAFGANRRIIVTTPNVGDKLEDPSGADGPFDLGYMVTLQDDNGAGLGDWRVIAIEFAPDGCQDENGEEWYVRVTLLGSTTIVLPTITAPGGHRTPGLAEVEDMAAQHQLYTQRSDQTRIGASTFDNAATTGPSVTADGSGINRGLVAAVSSFDVGTDEGLFLYIEAQCTDAAGTIDIDVLLTPSVGGSHTIHQERVDTPGTSKVIKTIWIEAQALVDILGMSGTMQSVTLTVWNRSGADRTLYLKIGAHVVKKHFHN